jgi:hypothetical protein
LPRSSRHLPCFRFLFIVVKTRLILSVFVAVFCRIVVLVFVVLVHIIVELERTRKKGDKTRCGVHRSDYDAGSVAGAGFVSAAGFCLSRFGGG